MNNKFEALLRNHTWTLVPPSETHNVIGSKWVFQIKRKADGQSDRYKAQLVTEGFHQQSGIDYFETYSPVVKPTTMHTILSLAFSVGWAICQVDVHNAFLHRDLFEEVFMS